MGLDREHLSAMRRGLNRVNLIYALEIEKYMREKTKKILHLVDLVSPWMKYRLKNLTLPCMEQPIEITNISLNSVKFSHTDVCFAENVFPKNVFPNLNQLRPIILNENQQLIANPNTYLLYKLQGKKTVPAWQISLADLLARKYLPSLLVQTFLICERVAIGIAAKNFLGNRQGERSDLKLRRNFDEVKGRTDELLAFLLGLGAKDNYRLAQKIYLFGSEELIHSVNEEKLTISMAARLIHLPHKKHKKILKLNKKEIRNFIYRFKGGNK